MLHRCLFAIWRLRLNDSHLHYTTKLTPQQHTTVKFHGVFTSHWETLVFAPGKKFSEDSNRGQWRSRYAIHAGRQSNGKAFRYLKRVIVTPAVYLSLASLKKSFGYRHWADVTSCTHPYGLAGSCVFVKQSDLPSHCALHLHSYEYKRRDPLYRRHGANLPNSLD